MRELAAALPRTLVSLPARIASRPFTVSLSPRMRRRLLLAALATGLLGSLYQFWFRDSALVAVSDVQISGLTTKDAPRIEATLIAASLRWPPDALASSE